MTEQHEAQVEGTAPEPTVIPAVTPLDVYDLKDWILSQDFNKERSAKGGFPLIPGGFDTPLAIIEGPKGVLVFCTEGVGWQKADLDAEWTIEMHPDEPHTIFVHNTHSVSTTLRKIKESATVTQVEAKEFVRRFGHRLELNFHGMLRSLAEIGLNPDDYYKGGR